MPKPKWEGRPDTKRGTSSPSPALPSNPAAVKELEEGVGIKRSVEELAHLTAADVCRRGSPSGARRRGHPR